MRTIILGFLFSFLAINSSPAQTHKLFSGNYRTFFGADVNLYNPDNGLFNDTEKYSKVYRAVVLKVSNSGNISGNATTFFTDISSNRTSKIRTVKFSGKIGKISNLLYANAKIADFTAKGTDGSVLAGKAIYEKSAYGLAVKRNLSFEIVTGRYNGSGLLVYSRP